MPFFKIVLGKVLYHGTCKGIYIKQRNVKDFFQPLDKVKEEKSIISLISRA